MFYVYVLRSQADGNFYVGFSEDLRKRFADHNAGKNISTQLRKPLKLVFYEAFLDKFDALRRERYFKTSKGRTVLKQLIRENLSKE